MAAKSKSRVSKSKKSKFQFKWWMAVILVVIVGGIGIAILRFSKASSDWQSIKSWGPADMTGGTLIETKKLGPTERQATSTIIARVSNLTPGSYRLCFNVRVVDGNRQGTNLAYGVGMNQQGGGETLKIYSGWYRSTGGPVIQTPTDVTVSIDPNSNLGVRRIVLVSENESCPQ